jgi:ATP-dependent DNA ligase
MTSIGHIIDSMIIPEGVTLDGELYHHGTHLQTISSWVKRKQASTFKLKYICYDAIVPGNYMDRLAILKTIQLGDNAVLAQTTVGGTTYAGINQMLAEARRLGYEGLIIRPHGYQYEDGKRSKGLIKVKTWMDEEFRVVRIEASTDGWAVLRCALNDDTGRTFGVSAPGDIPTRERVLTNKQEYIGKSVKVEFACYTVEKKPFHPVAICWREVNEE